MASISNTTIAPKMLALLQDYGSYHLNPKNKITHYIGIPMITVTLLGLLSRVVLYPVNEYVQLDLGVVLYLFAFSFYIYLDWKLGSMFAVVGVGLYALGRVLPWEALLALFIIGWIFQYVGHLKYEKNSPAFYKNAEHIFIGPMWIFARAIGYYR